MNDTRELWELCPHGRGPAHRYSMDIDGASQGNLPCAGGTKIVLRRMPPAISAIVTQEEDVLWMEVVDG